MKLAEAYRIGREKVPTHCVGNTVDIDLVDGKLTITEADHVGAIVVGMGLIDPETFPFERATWYWPQSLDNPITQSPCSCWLMTNRQHVQAILVHLADMHTGRVKRYPVISDERVYQWLKVLDR